MTARPRARAYDPAKTRTALLREAEAVRTVAAGLPAEALAAPTRLPGWTTGQLITQLAAVLEELPRLLAGPAPARGEQRLDVQGWLAAYRRPAEVTPDPDPLARLTAAVRALEGAEADPGTLLRSPHGPVNAGDFALTLVLRTVLHADDLAAATGLTIAHDRQALAITTRLLADALAHRAPGGSVEVRIPPFAVVQCVQGPRHTRGTPPNVVETDPLTWLRLAAGRTAWSSAVAEASVTASGERADISAQLPLLD
ncbi:sterol carrier family protein [Streptomyces orinoci]|uniref:Sterol carrier family protein n=1 Tax=Streptomyces orinoci TaxID=67339 RepID=A0ABV3K1I2_STRON|nr:sterol carrier family protein [Streptomyces orinoci]